MKIVTAQQMQQIDRKCGEIGLPTEVLMENAGKAVAEEVKRILGEPDKQNILLLIGPGNNGGDGLVAARYLHDWGATVNLCLFGSRPEKDNNLELVHQHGLNCISDIVGENLDEMDDMLSSASVVIDALFGTGKSRSLGDMYARALNKVSGAKAKRKNMKIIAVDLPSGLNADTGAVDSACLFADNTITLALPKTGLFNAPGAERVGRLSIVDIGIPEYLADGITTELITDEWAQSVLPARPLNANKGTFGKALVVAGSINYIGAAELACNGAMRVGVGLVTLATAESVQSILARKLTEVTYLPLAESGRGVISAENAGIVKQELKNYNVMLIGCGLGQSESVTGFIQSVLLGKESLDSSMVIDADALNILSKTPKWWQSLPDDAILTPHPGEMARLAGITVKEVQSDRVGVTRNAAKEWNKTIVLKGAYTVVSTPDGSSRIIPIANPGLASAGTGDVLAGVITGLLAQGLTLRDSAALGVYLHGKAGEEVSEKLGDAGMIASDLLPELPLVIKKLKENQNN